MSKIFNRRKILKRQAKRRYSSGYHKKFPVYRDITVGTCINGKFRVSYKIDPPFIRKMQMDFYIHEPIAKCHCGYTPDEHWCVYECCKPKEPYGISCRICKVDTDEFGMEGETAIQTWKRWIKTKSTELPIDILE